MVELLFWLLFGHALADYPLQGDFLSRAKQHRNPMVASNGKPFPWQLALIAHALIHAGMVAHFTQSLLLGALEFVAHVAIDYATAGGRVGYWTDQALHVLCKILWVGIAVLTAFA